MLSKVAKDNAVPRIQGLAEAIKQASSTSPRAGRASSYADSDDALSPESLRTTGSPPTSTSSRGTATKLSRQLSAMLSREQEGVRKGRAERLKQANETTRRLRETLEQRNRESAQRQAHASRATRAW